LSVYPVHQNGKLPEASDVIVHGGSGPNPNRQEGPHMHSMIPAKNGKYVYASDLGTDVITAYRLNRGEGTLSANENQRTKVKPGSGPRHFDIHPSGNFAYSAEELSSTIAAYSIDPSNGALNFIERKSMIPEDFTKNNTAADIQVSPDGRFVYASNRGHNSLAIFSTGRQSGKLESVGHTDVHGERPRNFLIDRKGEFLFVANRNSDEMVVFRRNKDTGKLHYTGKKVTVPAAVCIQQLRLP
ncbi:MAG: lactonase family protein, partial [Bacteroidales bacterium]|nr:lactonase family protein [Bacteroidales bacterium]